MEKSDIMSFDMDEICSEMAKIGENTFIVNSIYEWLHVKLVSDFDEMTDL